MPLEMARLRTKWVILVCRLNGTLVCLFTIVVTEVVALGPRLLLGFGRVMTSLFEMQRVIWRTLQTPAVSSSPLTPEKIGLGTIDLVVLSA